MSKLNTISTVTHVQSNKTRGPSRSSKTHLLASCSVIATTACFSNAVMANDYTIGGVGPTAFASTAVDPLILANTLDTSVKIDAAQTSPVTFWTQPPATLLDIVVTPTGSVNSLTYGIQAWSWTANTL